MADKDTQPMSQRADDSQNVAPTNDSPSWGLLFWRERRERDTERLRIGKDMYKVGRGLASDIVLTQDNSSLPVDKLSRVHCGFKRTVDMISGDQTILEDYSSNGTFVNGVKIGQGRSKLLYHRDVIAFTCPHKKIFTYLDTQYRHPSFPAGISKKYVIAEDLGKGSFGDVWLVIHKQTNKQYALKSVTRRYEQYLDDRFDTAMMQLKNEAELLCTLIHPCIVKVEDVICRTNSIHLVLELMHGGDLQARLSGRPQLKEATAKYYFFQLALAVEFCHKLGVVHRDLKPENILLSSKEEDAILKITDFGLSKLVDENTMLKTYCGTPMYLAPEVVEAKDEKSHYTSSVDVWSLGVILFVLLSGYHPFMHSKPLEKLIAKADYKLKKEKWKKVSKDGLALVKKMLQVDPDSRPTLTEILDHPWMQDPDIIVKVRKLVFANCPIGGHSVFHSSFSSLTENDPIFDPLPPKRRRIES